MCSCCELLEEARLVLAEGWYTEEVLVQSDNRPRTKPFFHRDLLFLVILKSLVWNEVQSQQLLSEMHSEHPERLCSSAAALSHQTQEQHLGQNTMLSRRANSQI